MDPKSVAELQLLNPWAIRLEALRAVAMGAVSGRPDAQVVVAEPRTAGGVAVIPLRGLITPRGSFLSMLLGGGGGLQSFRDSLREAIGNDDVGSILIDIDSPGGSTSLVTETAADIRAAREQKPVVAVANTWAMSAAYWLAAQADEIVVTPSGEVGSVGVYAVHDDWSGFNEKMGVIPTYVSAGRFKTDGNPDGPLSDSAREEWQGMVDEFYDQFVADVAAGRGVSADMVRSGFGEGRAVRAQTAVKLGMADTVGTFEQTVVRMASGSIDRLAVTASRIQAAPDAVETLADSDDQPEPVAERVAQLLTARPH